MIQDPSNHDVEIQDDGVDPGLLPPAPSGWSDPLTGTDGPRLWDRIITSEVARVARYKRPATVVLVEVVGLAPFGRMWGADVAERLFIQLARTLAVEIRSSDHIARIDHARFAILLTETDEIAAINFVERARAACDTMSAHPSSCRSRRLGEPVPRVRPAGRDRQRHGTADRRVRSAF